MKRLLAVICVTALILSTTAHSQSVNTFWAAPGGRTSGACTTSTTDPGSTGYLSFGYAALCATPAMTPWIINLKGTLGVYSQQDHRVRVSHSGGTHNAGFSSGLSASNPNIVRTAPGEPTAVITTSGGWIHFAGASNDTTTTYRRNNLTFRNFRYTGGTSQGDQVFLATGSNLVWEDCEMSGSATGSVATFAIFTRPNHLVDANHTIRRCVLHDFNSYGIYGIPKNSLIEDNEIYRTRHAGVQIQYDHSNTTVRGNYIHDVLERIAGSDFNCQGMYVAGFDDFAQGAVSGRAPGVKIYNNRFEPKCPNGGAVNAGIAIFDTEGLLAANNTFILAPHMNAVDFSASSSQGSRNAQLLNNLIIGGSATAIRNSSASTYTANFNACTTAQNCATSSNGTIGTKRIITGVLSCLVSSTDWHLHPNSPNVCVNGGTNTSAVSTVVTTDFEGTPRPQGSTWDVGADELGNQPGPDTTPPAPPTGVTITKLEY